MNKLNLNAETICDFYVDEQRKNVWQIELDIVEKIDEICRKHNLKYSLAGGSLLGAVRHKGFIPWDDDIDIVMLRDSYNKFLDIAEKEFPEPYFVQYYKTEKGYYYGHAQIRNSNTTAITKGDANNNFNHGIFVDIFPLDNIPDDQDEKEKFLKKVTRKKKVISIIPRGNLWLKIVLKKIWIKIRNIDKEIETFEKFIQKYDNIETKQVGALGFRQEEFKYEKKWLEEIRDVKFEYLNLMGSTYYDEWLKRQYGNYLEIPKDKNGTLHGNMFFDTKKSYKYYLKNIKEIEENL